MSILVNAQVVFHEMYGYSLNIIDIEPSFTLGDIELKRRETISKLIADGVMEMNKEQELDLLPKRIAIISSPSAAGLQDFTNQLDHNQFGYQFEYELFPSVMQGDDAEDSITNSLNKIYDIKENFDVVVIVRGGGAQTDLACFDSYQLSSNIAQFPIPILTGIGHDKDVSVADMVAYKSLKTPTAVAEFLISRFNDAESILADFTNQIETLTEQIINAEIDKLNNNQLKLQYFSSTTISHQKTIISNISKTIPYISKQLVKNQSDIVLAKKAKLLLTLNSALNIQKSTLNATLIKINKVVPQRINDEKNRQNYLFRTTQNLNPTNVLERGYSITYYNGKILKSAETVNVGDEIKTILKKGEVIGNIVKKEP
jgi:exodeoxyribonuclease VII large subunit